MSNYIVDCRYVRTTTPVGKPDFTIQVEASSPELAMLLAEKNTDAYGDFTATGACETLALVEMLRSHVSILAQFGLEMVRKSREAGSDVAEFEALVEANGIAIPESEDDDDARTERLREEDEEGETWDHYTYDQRQREAKLAFEHYDFEAYGGIAVLVGWFGVEDEERALITLGGYAKPEHVFVVEFEEGTANIVHVGVEPFQKTPWQQIDHYDGSIIQYNRQS